VSDTRTASNAAQRAGSGAGRLMRAWRSLPHERRFAVYAAIGLFLTLFLPWYQETVVVPTGTKHPVVSVSVSGWAAFSFVEAAVLLVAAGVLLLLFQRAEGKAFHVPGGDGGVITAAGIWTCVLVIWRIFDKQSTSIHGPGADISGIEWGIFVALAVAACLAYAGTRIRAAHRPEPPLPGEQRPAPGEPSASPPSRRSRHPPAARPGAFEASPSSRTEGEVRPTRRRRSNARQAERSSAQPDALGWKEPGTDWIDGQGRRTQRGAAADPGIQRDAVDAAPARRGAADDAGERRDAVDEPRARRGAADDAGVRRDAVDEPRARRGSAAEAGRQREQTDDLGTQRAAADEARAQRETTDDPPARRGGTREAAVQRSVRADRRTQAGGPDEAPTLHHVRDEPPAGRGPADDGQTEPLGPSTHAARRLRQRDDS
jgi:hypothetical protein